jgi:hypothetical protein
LLVLRHLRDQLVAVMLSVTHLSLLQAAQVVAILVVNIALLLALVTALGALLSLLLLLLLLQVTLLLLPACSC